MITCPSCGEQNPARARVCMMCATPLATPDQAGRRERRVVSVLFCDLVGFTNRSEQQDVEDVEAFLGRYHRLLRQALEQHGGTVEKFIGDAVMALFGAPIAHEDDAERAVRAALAIQDAVADMRTAGGDVHVRVGVTTGEALVALGADTGRGEGMASGDVVNTAARLQAAAPADGVLVDEATYRATDRAIRFQPADPVAAKGKAEPVAVWLAVATRSIQPEQSRVDDLPLVGRSAEVSRLTGTFDQSRSDPSTQLVTIVGAPGIGKTRLVDELGRYVEDLPVLVRWRRGRCLAYGEGVALWALGEMVKAEAGILESDPSEDARRKLQEAVSAVIADERDRVWVARHLRPLVGLETEAGAGDGGPVEAFAAWRRFFEALAEDGPTVLVFEDLHWADDVLLDFIELLADRAGRVPLLIGCTSRPELLERRAAWAGGKPNSQTILVSPLSSEDTARLIGELLGQGLLPADTKQALLDRAEGNPLYAQEYVRMLHDRGALVRDAAGPRLTAHLEGLPDSVQAIIAARLDTLSDGERALIQDAAVVGRTAWAGAVGAISERSAWELDELLHQLERKQLMGRSRRSSVEDEVEFSFAHALTQEVAYAQIRRSERAQKHERVAAWIDRLAGERDDKAELLAHHLAAAYDLRRQAGEVVDHLTARLRAARTEAGLQAMAVNAHAAAARHLNGALELTPDDAPERPRLLLQWLTASERAGERPDPATARAVLEAQLAAGNMPGAADACRLIAVMSDDATAIDQAVEEGLGYAFTGAYTPVVSRLASLRAYRLYVGGRGDEVAEFTADIHRRAAAAGDEVGAARLLIWHGDARVEAGDPGGVEEMQQATVIFSAHSSFDTAQGYINLGQTLVGLGDLGAAAEARTAGGAWAERFGAAYQSGMAEAAISDSAYHAGDWSRAAEMAARLRAHSDGQVRASAAWTDARIALARGQQAIASQLAAEVFEYATTVSDDEGLLYALAIGELADHSGGGDRLLERWHEVGGMAALADVLAELAPVAEVRDRLAAAAALLAGGSRWPAPLTAVAEGRFAEAAAAYREMGSRPLEAMAHLLAAEHGDRADRTAHARTALEFFSSVAATAYAERAAGLARATA